MENLIISQLKDVAIDCRTRVWCKSPYPGHLRGCPAWGKKKICPPHAPLFEKIIGPPLTLVAIKFDLSVHVRIMKKKHPGWSEKQAKCVLYWQGRVNKYLKNACEEIVLTRPNSTILYKPEAAGINVFETCKRIGLILEKNPKQFVYKIAIIGQKIC